MSDKAVKTLLDVINCRYAKIIARSAFAYLAETVHPSFGHARGVRTT